MSQDRSKLNPEQVAEINRIENQEWIDSLDYVLASAGERRTKELLEEVERYAYHHGVRVSKGANTPYINTIPEEAEPEYPGDLEMERRIRNINRWNSVAMVIRGNKSSDGIGGHISTYTSSAELLEVGFNHFFRGHDSGENRDLIFYQGHASPGMYARSFLEGRFAPENLDNFRRDLKTPKGLTSYPHPWLMPEYWEFPTVSMGLGPIQAIYQARYIKYLENRGLKAKGDAKVWAFLGDGEMDEPQSIGALRFAAYENLDNIIFVLNANLQRLDGPVRSNSKVIQEFEALFLGAGWNVIKVVWDSKWDELLRRDTSGILVRRFEELVDGESQRYAAFGGKELRERFFNTPELKKLIEGWSDADLDLLNRGGHDPVKVYAAYQAAVNHKGSPTVIIARTIKGWGLGEAAQARNVAHQVKKLDETSVKGLRDFVGLPIDDASLAKMEYYHPGADSPEVKYTLQRRKALGGLIPARQVKAKPLNAPEHEFFAEFYAGSNGREVSTTMAFVQVLSKLLRHPELGKLIVPIIPDEARTFGMDALVPRIGIYSPRGQNYEPVDSGTLMAYKESVSGQMLEEGITEDGAMSSFIAAGTAYATHGVPTIPFFVLYSMFGMQRVGDLVWAAADQRTKGFVMGATAGRTTLNGEGLQHQDGNSLTLAYPVPNLKAYDPTFAYEIAVIVQDGIKRMYQDMEDIFYYVTIENENYVHFPMPEPVEATKAGILKGMYRLKAAEKKGKHQAQILTSGAILGSALQAQKMLETYDVAADLWSVTSYKELHQDALSVQRYNMLHPSAKPQEAFVASQLNPTKGVLVAVSDYIKLNADALSGHLNRKMWVLGTDGFGRSESREALRDFFEVDAKHIVLQVLYALLQDGKIKAKVVEQAIADLGINPETPNPITR